MGHAHTDTLLTAVDREWEQRYAGAAFDLNGGTCLTAEEVVQHLRTLVPSARDAALLTVIDLAQSGDRTAQHVILQTMRSTVLNLATRRMPLRKLPHAEAVDIAVTAMLETVALYPTNRWKSSVTTNLARKTQARLVHEDTGGDSVQATELDETIVEALDHDIEESPEAAIATVLSWALESATLTPDEVRLVATWELGDAASRARLSEETGISQQTLRQRSYRLRTKIHAAVQRHIADVGRW